jgi:hypothetical protein
MDAAQIYILISIGILLAIFVIFIFSAKRSRKEKTFTPLAGIAFAFVLGGIIFGDNRLIGYSLMGIGIILSIIDIIVKKKSRKK